MTRTLLAALLVGVSCSSPEPRADEATDEAPRIAPSPPSASEALVGWSAASMEGSAFTPDAAPEMGVAGDGGYGRGVSIIDLDGDGWDDLVLTDTDHRARPDFTTTRAFHNEAGRLVPWDLGFADDDLLMAAAIVFGDYDNDGRPDAVIVAGNNTGQWHLSAYRNELDEGGRFRDVTEPLGITDQAGLWWSATWSDVDLDGFLDLLVIGPRTILYRNDGGRRFVDETDERGLDVYRSPTISRNSLFIDVDNDGDPDLVAGGGSPHVVLENDGAGRFRDVTEQTLGPLDDAFWRETFVISAADLNDDGWEDLYFGRYWYEDAIFLNRGDGTFERHGPDIGLVMRTLPEGSADLNGSGWITAGAAPSWDPAQASPPGGDENSMGLLLTDLDGDGVTDAVVGTGDPGRAAPDIAFCGSRSGPAGYRVERCDPALVAANGSTRSHGMAAGDLDRNGSLDLVINSGGFPPFDLATGADSTERTKLFRGAVDRTASVTQVRLRTHDRAAVGARLRVEGGRPAHATVRSSLGFQSQSSEVITVAIDGPVDAEVTWPGGRTTTHRLEPGRIQVVEEPAGS